MEFKPVPQKITAKGDGVIEIVLKIENGSLYGKMDQIQELIKRPCVVSIRPNTAEFVTERDKNTKQPLVRYQVDDTGIVEAVHIEQEQLELEGIEKLEVEKETQEIDIDIIDQFILEAGQPEFDGIDIDPQRVIMLQKAGKSDREIASDLEIETEALITQMDEYKRLVAPYAFAWWSWKTGK
ncbi:hypothetical protein HCA99_00335 [Listeria booriae]|uniref:hypothetical protein n=1 Tax=Listeria booriae TaxID=1552123 RepID=UPI001623E143|nr:hypothetical protein [Listeria booriae]MBC2077654.1 hypothetical protein [Listeria booriae]